MNKNSMCEIQVGGKWEPTSVEDPLAINPKELKRCPECKGRVVVMRDGKAPSSPAHYEHRPKHDGCSHSHGFKPTIGRSPHPDPLD